MARAAAMGSAAGGLGIGDGYQDQVVRQREFFTRFPHVHFVHPYQTYPLRRACWIDENGTRHEITANDLESLLDKLDAEFGEKP